MGLKAHFKLLSAGLLLCTASQQSLALDERNPDPWEGFNRKVFVFNDTLDRFITKPIAKGYRAITPDPVETSVSNFYANLEEIRNILNDVLQWKWGQAGNDTGRFLINTTVGVVGLFDVARHAGLPRSEGEDFGQTLSVWGAGSGPYIVLPFMGPSTLRDAAALPVNSYVHPIGYVDHVPTRNTLTGGDLLETRAGLLEVEGLISGDKYGFMRDAFLQRREYLILDGEIEDDFGGDDF